MKPIFIILSLIMSSALLADEKEVDNSITVHNFTTKDQAVWVNAVNYSVSFDSSLRVGCYSGESIEVQVGNKSSYYDCGSSVELN